jgi:hypothetical protein
VWLPWLLASAACMPETQQRIANAGLDTPVATAGAAVSESM